MGVDIWADVTLCLLHHQLLNTYQKPQVTLPRGVYFLGLTAYSQCLANFIPDLPLHLASTAGTSKQWYLRNLAMFNSYSNICSTSQMKQTCQRPFPVLPRAQDIVPRTVVSTTLRHKTTRSHRRILWFRRTFPYILKIVNIDMDYHQRNSGAQITT